MHKKIVPFFLIMFLISVVSASAGVVVLAWDKNTEDDLAGYKLHYGPSSGVYTQTVTIAGKDADTTSVTLSAGTYYFALTAFDVAGNESGYSNEVSTYVYPPDLAPSNPINLHIVE